MVPADRQTGPTPRADKRLGALPSRRGRGWHSPAQGADELWAQGKVTEAWGWGPQHPPGGNKVLPWRRHIAAVLLHRARMRRRVACLYLPRAAARQRLCPGLCRALPDTSPPCPGRPRPRGPFTALQPGEGGLLLSARCCHGTQPPTAAGSLGTAWWSRSNQRHRSFTAAFASRRAAGARSPKQMMEGKPLAPHSQDPRDPKGDHRQFTHKPGTKPRRGGRSARWGTAEGAVPVTGQARRERK